MSFKQGGAVTGVSRAAGLRTMSGADKKWPPSEQLKLDSELSGQEEEKANMHWSVGSNNGDDAGGGGGGGGERCLECHKHDGDDGDDDDDCNSGSCYCNQDVGGDADRDALDKRNLDSGYAWLILVIMFLLQSSISGASRVYGIVYAKEVSINYYDREEASWPIATASAVENLAGILTPAITSYLSWRKIELLSTGLLILSNLLAYFSCSLTVDIIALGVIQGLALSTCTVLSLVINNDYFERYRTTAYGISMSGSTFGVLYLSPLVSWLLTEYDNFRLVYLALALVFCGNLILVLFIKPRAKTIKNRSKSAENGHAEATAKGAKHGSASMDELEIDKIRQVLEGSLEGRGGGTLKVPLSRERSRFEMHFERKNSIASVSYLARSRRESVLSKQHMASAAPIVASNNNNDNRGSCCYGSSTTTKPIYTIEQAPWSTLTKSKSGIELVRTSSHNPGPQLHNHPHPHPHQQPQQQQRRWNKISLVQQTSSPLAGSNFAQEPIQSSQRHQQAADSSPIQEPFNAANRGSVTGLSEQGPFQSSTESGSQPLVDLENKPLPPSRSPSLLLLAQSQQQHQQQQHLQYLANCANSSNSIGQFNGKELMDVKSDAINPKPPAPQSKGGFSLDRMAALLRLPYLHCTWIMLAIYYLIARVFVIILVDFAGDHGFGLSESTNLLNYWSIGELGGRILLAPLIDLQYMSCKNCIVTTCSLLAGSIIAMVMIESYIAYAICSLVIAALISLEYMLINVLMVEYVGKDQVTSCYSLAACLCSLVLFARPSMIGLFRDHLGSYDGLLILLASIAGAFALLFFALEPLLVRYWPKRQFEQASKLP